MGNQATPYTSHLSNRRTPVLGSLVQLKPRPTKASKLLVYWTPSPDETRWASLNNIGAPNTSCWLVLFKPQQRRSTSEENHTVQANSNPINTSVLSPSRWLTPLPCLKGGLHAMLEGLLCKPSLLLPSSLPPIPWICGCTRSAELSYRVLMSSW